MISGSENTVVHKEPLFKKTRLAPTPSGYLHLGNILSFVLTVSLARKTGAKVLLRIDDMDRDRAMPHFIQDIFDTLNFLEIPWDEGPSNVIEFDAYYAQKCRLPLYIPALQQLQEGDHLFACTCSRTAILRQSADGSYPGTCRHGNFPLHTPNVALRVCTLNATEISIRQLNGMQQVYPFPEAMRHFVVRKKDGAPAYQLCSLVDDLHFGVDLIVRGADLWPSTLAQYYLSTLLKEHHFNKTAFYHHPLLLDECGHKMSKSAGSTSIYQLRREGKKPAQIFTLIARLLGIDEPVSNWQSLAHEVVQAQYLSPATFAGSQ